MELRETEYPKSELQHKKRENSTSQVDSYFNCMPWLQVFITYGKIRKLVKLSPLPLGQVNGSSPTSSWSNPSDAEWKESTLNSSVTVRHAGTCWLVSASFLSLHLHSSIEELLSRQFYLSATTCSWPLCSSSRRKVPCLWAPWQFPTDTQFRQFEFEPVFAFLPIQLRFIFFDGCPTFSPSASIWWRCEVPPALHSLVTAYLQRSQAQASGTAPRSGLGDRGVSQETEHKYRDPNNLITSGAIRPRFLEAYPEEGVCVWRRIGDEQLGTGWSMKVFWVITTAMGGVNLRYVKICAIWVRFQSSPHWP